MKKWKNIVDLVFHVCLAGIIKKWSYKQNERIKTVNCISLHLQPYYIKKVFLMLYKVIFKLLQIYKLIQLIKYQAKEK